MPTKTIAAISAAAPFPQIFNNPNVSGIEGNVLLDYYGTQPSAPRGGTLALTAASIAQKQPVITTSFSSKSEGSLHLSVDGKYLTYMGYNAAAGLTGVSNSETTNPNAQITGATGPFYDRAVALIASSGLVSVTPQDFAYSGDNPRGVISLDGHEFYMAGNADSTLNSGGTTGPGLTIGARYTVPGNPGSTQLGSYFAADRPDESAKQHIKDNNWRGIGFFPDANGNENLYVSKGSGGNGDDGLFQVLNGSFTKPTLAQVVNNGLGAGIPTIAKAPNSIVQLLGNYATNPNTNQPSPITPFGFFFANPTTLYVADEGNSTITLPTDSNETETSLTTDPLAGLQKWVLVPGSSPYWQLVYVIRDGLQINQPQKIPGYGIPTFTTGLRNLTGKINGDGTVTIYAITAQTSTVSGGEPDPTKLVAVTDEIAATQLPVDDGKGGGGWSGGGGNWNGGKQTLDQFVTLQQSRSGEVFRGVAFTPSP